MDRLNESSLQQRIDTLNAASRARNEQRMTRPIHSNPYSSNVIYAQFYGQRNKRSSKEKHKNDDMKQRERKATETATTLI